MSQKIYHAIYSKSNNKILQLRVEMSDNANTLSSDSWLIEFCSDRGLDANNFATVILSTPTPNNLGLDQFLFNVETNSVVSDPTWIEPPAMETTNIPVSTPSGEL